MGPLIHLPEAIAQVFITDELHLRTPPDPDYLREKLALQDLASQMSDHPTEVLPRLVKLAMEVCGAESAGISILEPESEQFRWYALSGVLASFEGATTPRHFSPCGVCLDAEGPVLMARPERAYDWIRDANISVPEVLLVPLKVKDLQAVGTLWIVSSSSSHFHSEHSRVMTELAAFAGMALRMIQTEERLTVALQQQETLTREMSHRVKNLFAITDGMIRMTARTTDTKEEMVKNLSGRLHALSQANSLVRRSFGDDAQKGVGLKQAISTILAPYDRASADGPDIPLGDHATNSMALIFHELATNASKYGALSVTTGSVAVSWSIADDTVLVKWQETGGPKVTKPGSTGFGTALVKTTVERHAGTFDCDWKEGGLAVELAFPVSSLTR